jgi:hypothetical protein
MTKDEIAAEEKRLSGLIAALEARHPDRSPDEWKPWHAHDDALSMEHWKLAQARLNLKYERPTRMLTPEQRQAAGKRLNAARKPLRIPPSSLQERPASTSVAA